MKPYGHNSHVLQTCRYGCCGATPGVGPLRGIGNGDAEDRAARKRARRKGREEIAKALVED